MLDDIPPSAGILVPRIHFVISDSKNATMGARSSGVPGRSMMRASSSARAPSVSRKSPKLNDSRQQDREASLFFDGDSSLRIHQLCKFIDCCHHGKTPRQCFDLFAFTSETSWMKKTTFEKRLSEIIHDLLSWIPHHTFWSGGPPEGISIS